MAQLPGTQWRTLREKRYREAFVASQIKQAIPYQIRALMKAQGLTQAQLAERSGLSQGVISRAASPMYGNLSLNTVVRVAAGFDVAFVGRFVPFSEMTRWLDRLGESAHVATFKAEDHASTGEKV
jgi:transcriptional regulator with XRE-family HTH domain